MNYKSYEDISNTYKSYQNAYNYNTGCIVLIIFCSIFINFPFIVKATMIPRTISYILLTACHIGILILFILSGKTVCHSGNLVYYKKKNNYRFRLLIFFIVYIIIAIYENLSTLYVWKQVHKLEEEEKEKKEMENGKETPLYDM